MSRSRKSNKRRLRAKAKRAPGRNERLVLTAEQRFDAEKPMYDGFAIGHGAHGDTGYNRRRSLRELKRRLSEDD